MANFVKFGTDCADIAKVCVSNNNRKDMALFVMEQDKAIRARIIKEREEAATAQANSQSGSTADSKSRRVAALERLKAQMGNN